MKEGIRYTFNHKFVGSLLLFWISIYDYGCSASFLTYLQVARVFGPEAWRLSVLEAVFGAGLLLGSILISVWGGFKNRLVTFFLSYIAMGIGAIGLGIPFDFLVYIGFWGFTGFFISLASPVLVGMIQEKVDPQYIEEYFLSLVNTDSESSTWNTCLWTFS